jgi:hypothetical protein
MTAVFLLLLGLFSGAGNEWALQQAEEAAGLTLKAKEGRRTQRLQHALVADDGSCSALEWKENEPVSIAK